MSTRRRTDLRQRGFTLIEVLVTIVIVAILAAIAYPTYQDQVRKSRRTEAISNLLIMANLQERYYQSNFLYPVTNATIVFAPPAGAYYTYDIPVGNTTTFTVRARAPAASAQYLDTKCRTFALTGAGARAATDSGGADSTAQCWQR